MAQFMTRTPTKGGTVQIGGGDPGNTGGGDPGNTGGGDPGNTGGGDPGNTGGGDPGNTGGGDPGNTGGGDPGNTGGGSTRAYAPAMRAAPRPAAPVGPIVIAQGKIAFRIQRQEQSEWCWAAVAASVERFFDPSSKLQQCEVANKVIPKGQLPKNDHKCCDGCRCCAEPELCNLPAELEVALQKIHKWRNTLERPLTFEELQREIDAGRPVCVGIEWSSGGGHFAVVRGYRVLNSGARQVYVADPLNPSCLVDFDEFTSAYYGDGEWVETDLVERAWT